MSHYQLMYLITALESCKIEAARWRGKWANMSPMQIKQKIAEGLIITRARPKMSCFQKLPEIRRYAKMKHVSESKDGGWRHPEK